MSLFPADLTAAAAELIGLCRSRGLHLATAESCTGGLASGLITSIAGASDIFDAGFVTYSNAAKTEMLGVPAGIIERMGAVSEETARAMAEGCLSHSPAHIGVSVTGIAGPGGGSALKPVGLVHLAAARRGLPILHERLALGDIGREEIRLKSVAAMLRLARAQAAAP